MISYDLGTGVNKNWILALNGFQNEYIRKCEAVFSQGNGYMGIRACMEELYSEQWRSTLVAGTFDQFENEVTELPPCADLTSMHLYIDDEPLNLNKGLCKNFVFMLDLKTAKLTRTFEWTTPNGKAAKFTFNRIVSLDDIHLVAWSVTVELFADCKVRVKTGIEGENRFGNVHFKPVYIGQNNQVLQYLEQTKQSNIQFILSCLSNLDVNGLSQGAYVEQKGNNIYHCYDCQVKAGDVITIEKKANIYTSRDKELQGVSIDFITYGKEMIEKYKEIHFDTLAKRSADKWMNEIWKMKDVVIDTLNEIDQLALRYAVYQLTVMTPAHDNRMNIAAKGLSGMGYKGHAFWDTEIYMLPFFIFTDPEVAKSLLISRYKGLSSAHRKALENGYVGAMYPWEAAWVDDGEVTPSWARTGLLEHHITADVAYSVYCYHMVTKDDDFMRKYGYEIIFDTAKYWQSRVTYNTERDQYEILHVIGPDEYTEDCDNNAFTNYMAHLNMTLALKYYRHLLETDRELLRYLSDKLELKGIPEAWEEKSAKLYLPTENENKIVPQDDTYLSLPTVDLQPYKAGKPFDLDVNHLQVSKQADVMVLFLLREDLFSQDIKRKNFYYYEPKCMHHSSLSLSSYSILAADVNEKKVAYELFEKACLIDIGPAPYSSDDGIHAASLGGIWQCVVLGFLGVRLYGENLRIQPNLPDNWNSVEASIFWRGQKLQIYADKRKLVIKADATSSIQFILNNKIETFSGKVELIYKEL